MTTQTEALTLLDEYIVHVRAMTEHIAAIKEALAQPEQEPVATSQETYNKICLGLAEAGCRLSEQQKMALASLVQDTTPCLTAGKTEV